MCATAYVYCQVPQAVERSDVTSAAADIERRDYETADPMETVILRVPPGRSTDPVKRCDVADPQPISGPGGEIGPSRDGQLAVSVVGFGGS